MSKQILYESQEHVTWIDGGDLYLFEKGTQRTYRFDRKRNAWIRTRTVQEIARDAFNVIRK